MPFRKLVLDGFSKRLRSTKPSLQSVEDFVNQEDVLDHYSLILLVGPLRTLSVLSSISDYALQRSIPLFYIHSIGFYSHFSIQLPLQFPIVDTHPDPASTQDLRLLSPWAELLDFVRMKTQDLELLDDHKHGHIPYLILLIHYLSVWKASHKGIPPANYSEKKEFKSLVQSGARTNNAEGGEENYDEAVASVLKSLNAPSLPSGLREVFEANSCQKGELDVSYRYTQKEDFDSNSSRRQISGSSLKL